MARNASRNPLKLASITGRNAAAILKLKWMARSWRNFKQGEYGLFYHWRVPACSDEFRARHVLGQ